MEITLTHSAATRLVQSLLKVGASNRPLTAKRKELIHELAARLSLDILDLAVAAPEGLWTPKHPGARKTLYLAASCLLAVDWEDADAETLDALASALELGAEARKLDFQARKGPEQLVGIRVASAPTKSAPTKTALPAPKVAAKTAPKRKTSRPSKPAPRARKTRPASELRRREPRTSEPGGAPKASGAPLYARPMVIGAAVGVLSVLVLIIALIPGGSKGPSAKRGASSAAFTERYNQVIAAWNKSQAPEAAPSFNELQELRRSIAGLIKDGGDPELVARLEELLSSASFERQWGDAVESRLTELTLAIARDRNREDYARAQKRLDGFPRDILVSAELKGQFAIIVKDLESWSGFSASAEAFIAMSAPSFKDLLAAHKLCEDHDDALTTAAYDRLKGWFTKQKRFSDELFDGFVAAVDGGDTPGAQRMLRLLQRVRPDSYYSYVTRKIRELVESMTPQAPRPGLAIASGTGFYVDRRHILTNAHVVGFLDSVSLEIGGRVVEGQVVARDSNLDLALIKTTVSGRPLDFNADIRGGINVFVYGYGVLAGSSNTFLRTRGFLSAVKPDQLIVDAKVNPGNSGGPLLDADGRWIGVVVAKTLSSQQVDSFGIAINGRAALNWVAAQGINPPQVRGSARGSAPPPELEASIVRIEAVVLSRR